jgi:aminoglycoside 3-N-acetyltransferase
MIAAPAREAAAVAGLLEKAGVPRDGVLFVHSAFRGLAAQGFRLEAFIEGLLEYMHPGTLVMPTMTWRVVTPKSPVFDELATPSHVGAVPEAFRLRYAARRSLHPTHSVAAAGTLTDHLLSGHHLDDTPCSPNSPYGRARAEDTHILMLGIGLERCTAIHVAEETVAPDVYLFPPAEAELYECVSRHGVTHRVRLRRHLKLNRDFPQFTAPLAAKGKLRRGDLAGTPWLAMTQRDLLDEVCGALERDPRAIIAPPGAPIIP